MKAVARVDENNTPIQTLDTHSTNVKSRMKKAFPANQNLSEDSHQKLLAIISLCHDIAKQRKEFQQFITSESYTATTKERSHAPQGAILAAAICFKQDDIPDEYTFIAYYAVYYHHQNLPDFQPIKDKLFELDAKFNSKVSTHKSELSTALQSKYTAPKIKKQLELITQESLQKSLKKFNVETFFQKSTAIEKIKTIELYRYYSSLCFADKMDSAGIPKTYFKGTEPNSQEFYEYTENFSEPETEFDEYRNQAQEEIKQNISQFIKSDSNFGRITLPTGYGKTVSAFMTSLGIIKETDKTNIIYALPFTSILDQIADDITNNYFKYESESPKFTVHHHLAKTKSELNEEKLNHGEVSEQKKALFAESWQSEIVLTTFVQLFESVIGPTNNQSIKLPSLKNSVILLDEIQSIPENWWPLISRVIQELIQTYNCYIVSLTATQPKFITQQSDITAYNLIKEPTDYYKYFKDNPRIRYKLDSSTTNFIQSKNAKKKDYNEAANEITDTTYSTLSITNTIKSTNLLYDNVQSNIKEKFDKGEYMDLNQWYYERNTQTKEIQATNKDIYYGILTSRTQPTERKEILDVTKKLLQDNKTVILCTTQIIEAGVDISFDKMYRDFAPLPNIIQAAGRCNRENKNTKSTVTIWTLESPQKEGKTPATVVYGPKVDRTRKILSESQIKLSEYYVNTQLQNEYYDNINISSNTLVTNYKKTNCKKLQQSSLIQTDYKTINIVIPLTKNEKTVLQKYRNPHNHQFEDINKFYQNLEQQIKNMTVSIPVYNLDEYPTSLEKLDENRYVLKSKAIDRCYKKPHTLKITNSVEDQFL